MALVRALITDALTDLGVLQVGETPDPAQAQLALRWVQRIAGRQGLH